MADGTIAKVKLDFEVLETISKVAREAYGLAGAVQHGASTLPPEVFDRFPKTGTAEIHLATEFQNMIYDQLAAPFKEEIYTYLRDACKDEMKAGQTDEQFIYKTRKKALGPFKRRFWELSPEMRQNIGRVLEEKFESLFGKLNVIRTREAVQKTVKPIQIGFALRDEIGAAEAESKNASKPKRKEEFNPMAD